MKIFLKTVISFFSNIVMIAGIFFIAGCNNEDRDISDQLIPDPENTITIEVKLNENFRFDSALPVVYINSNNQIDTEYYYYGSCWNFIEYGKVPGLGNITEIPPDYGINNNKWQLRGYEIKQGYGYVAYFWNGDYNQQNTDMTRTYVRFYVVKLLEENNTTVGAVIKYQCPFVL